MKTARSKSGLQKTASLLPPPAPPLALPRAIRTQLRRLSAKTVRVAWAEGLLWLLFGACTLVLAQTAADWIFDLSLAARRALLAADAVLACALFYRNGIRPVVQRPTLEEAALRAERHWPGLRNAIISSVQLAARPDGARWMVERLIRRTATMVGGMDFGAAVPSGHLRRLRRLAAACVLGVAALACWLAPRSTILLRRIALSDEALPTQTVVVPISGDFRIPAGRTIELAARARGVIPRAGRLEIQYAGKAPQSVPLVPKLSSPELFSFTIQNVQQPFTYRIFLNDGRGQEYKVQLFQPPVLEGVKFEQHYPAYTGWTPTQHSAGNLNLLAGSRLRISGRADRALKSAVVHLAGTERQVPMRIGGDGRAVDAEVEIPAQGLKGISVGLLDASGVESIDNTVYQVQVTPDKPPVITIAPGQPEDATVLAADTPSLRFAASDDFKVKEVFLCCELPAEGQADPAAAPQIKKIPIPAASAAASLAFDFRFENPAAFLPWKEGMTFTYWIEAVDNNDVTGPGVTRSPERRWSIVSAETKRQEMEEKMRKYSESLDDLSRTQETLRRNLENYIQK